MFYSANFAIFLHPGDLSLTECVGTLLILAVPVLAVFIFVYVFAKQKSD